ncbi:rhodanese-like domain-containing protein [bacterium]|nr:rhodanese-like domain-containing protein [bacterium]MBU1956892.1 rhodanese-like domain-containing protein [bacterium]
MIKQILLTLLCFTYAFSESNSTILQDNTVEAQYRTQNGKIQEINIGRNLDIKCKQVPIANGSFWSDMYASQEVPDVCKATFVTTSGQLSPMKIHDDVETFGELEVLDFIEEMQEDENMLLIDTRKPLWYKYRTIPTAINIPFEYILKPTHFKKEFKAAFKRLGVQESKKSYDFSQAKTIVLFCNASWCGQSPAMINSLISFGYPAKKIKWYRGGMASWLGLNMTSTKIKP